MQTKTKQDESAMYNEWKSLVQGFIGNVFERLSGNVSQRVHAWIGMLRRKATGSILLVAGLIYLVVGVAVYFDSVLGLVLPGLGYFVAGILAILVGYLVGNNKA